MVKDQFWNEIQNLQGRTLKTLDQKKPFDVVSVTESAVFVHIHSTNKERPISQAEIENACRRLVAIGRITRTEIMKEYSPYNPAYVAAILAELPGVKFKPHPIMLWIDRQ